MRLCDMVLMLSASVDTELSPSQQKLPLRYTAHTGEVFHLLILGCLWLVYMYIHSYLQDYCMASSLLFVGGQMPNFYLVCLVLLVDR
jgi:hypothetical protein